jgi:hypothetical protein
MTSRHDDENAEHDEDEERSCVASRGVGILHREPWSGGCSPTCADIVYVSPLRSKRETGAGDATMPYIMRGCRMPT